MSAQQMALFPPRSNENPLLSPTLLLGNKIRLQYHWIFAFLGVQRAFLSAFPGLVSSRHSFWEYRKVQPFNCDTFQCTVKQEEGRRAPSGTAGAKNFPVA